MVMDAWTFIPFMMIMILAGPAGHPERVERGRQGRRRQRLAVVLGGDLPADAAGVDHRDPDPHHLQAEAGRHRHQRHLGRPGRATDTVTSFIFREYRDRSNVGYGTLLAMVYLVVIVIVMTVLMKLRTDLQGPDMTGPRPDHP
jgi:multiple sugar transport system permease protein